MHVLCAGIGGDCRAGEHGLDAIVNKMTAILKCVLVYVYTYICFVVDGKCVDVAANECPGR